MKINKNSWHYELNKFADNRAYLSLDRGDNISLCQYFWYTVGAIVFSIMVCVGAVVLVAMGLAAVFFMLVIPLNALLYLHAGVGFDYGIGGVFSWYLLSQPLLSFLVPVLLQEVRYTYFHLG